MAPPEHTKKLILFSTATLVYFFLELITGYAINSLALQSDAFHMLSDCASLVVAIISLRLMKKERTADSEMTFGWVRAEILGALINGVFLLAVCFSIVTEAIQRLFEPPTIKSPVAILGVASAGLAFNLLGMVLFHGHHGHSHDHGHSHGHGHAHSHGHSEKAKTSDKFPLLPLTTGAESQPPAASSSSSASPAPGHSHEHREDHSEHLHESESDGDDHEHHHDHDHGHEQERDVEAAVGSVAKDKSLALHSIYLHVLGDALASIAVIGSGLFIWLTDFSWRFYVDPLISLLISVIIMRSALPLVRRTSLILLQSVPTKIDLSKLRLQLLQVRQVLGVHELHIWQLDDKKSVCSVHITCENASDFMVIAPAVKRILHKFGVHATTIQPEFLALALEPSQGTDPITSCSMRCSEEKCKGELCC